MSTKLMVVQAERAKLAKVWAAIREIVNRCGPGRTSIPAPPSMSDRGYDCAMICAPFR